MPAVTPRVPRRLLLGLLAGALWGGQPVHLRAQEHPSAAHLSAASRADQLAAAGDTAQALVVLDSAVRTNKRDAAAWLRLGVLQWNMAKAKRKADFISDHRTILLLQGADSALRLATQFAPDSARYWLTLGRFNLTSGVSTLRFAATGQVTSALDAATRSGDALLLAEAADEVGMATWRRYEAIANRALLSGGQQKIQLAMFNNFSRSNARDFIDSFVHKIEPPTGEADYRAALDKFLTAVRSDATSQRYSRHLYMAHGERGNWGELLALAERRARDYPLDAQSRLARGLALHRLGRDAAAQAAFDSALVLLDEVSAARLTKFTRILRPKATKDTRGTVGDAQSYAALPPAQQRGLEQLYWLMNDPLALTTENELRVEFLARVVWSDFRWTNEDVGLLGADTDRGDVYVRYGPPDLELTVPGTSSFNASNTDGGVTLVWAYRTGMVFFFDLPPGFGTARFAFIDKDNVDEMMSAVPVSWANVATTKLIDTLPVRVTRFRATADSTDAVIAARVPLDSIVRGLDLTDPPVDIDVRVFDQFVRVTGVESTQRRVAASTGAITQQWRRRLGPGINVVRVEALQADSRRGARAMIRLNPEATVGFGMSDVLLGTPPEARTAAPQRWTDVGITPTAGMIAHGGAVGLVWEVYALAAREGSARYRVAITVTRSDQSALGAFAARLLDGVGASIGRAQVRRNTLTISFDRTVAAADTHVESLALDMATAAAGSYRVRVEITDLVSGKRVARESPLDVR